MAARGTVTVLAFLLLAWCACARIAPIAAESGAAAPAAAPPPGADARSLIIRASDASRTRLIEFRDAVHAAVSTGRIQRVRLSGGPLLFCEHLPDARTLHAGIWIDVGSCNDPEGREGLAHLVEHLIFRSAAARGLRFVAATESNAVTMPDYTYYFSDGLPDQGPRMLKELATAVLDCRFDERGASIEKSVVARERAWWEDNLLVPLIRTVAARTGLPEDVLSQVLGTPESVNKITYDDIRRFYRQHYIGPRARIFLSGDLAPFDASGGESLEWLKTLPERPEGGNPARRPLPSPALPSELVLRTWVDQVYAGIIIVSPGWRQTRGEAPRLAEAALGNAFGGLLAVRLRAGEGVTDLILTPSDFGLPVDLQFADVGLAGVLVAAPPKAAAELRRICREAIERLASGRAGDAELRAWVRCTWMAETLRLQDPAARGIFVIRDDMDGGSGSVRDYLDRLKSMSPEEARRILQTYLAESKVTVLAVEPATGFDRIAAALRYLLLGRI